VGTGRYSRTAKLKDVLPATRPLLVQAVLLQTRLPVSLTDPKGRNNIVITVRAVHVSIRQIGNSQGVVIPKPVLAQLGLDAKAGVEMTIENGALVLRRPASPARTGWAEAARSIAEAGDDELVMGEFGNAGDSELVW
jgi:antitoxin MazE